MKYMKKVIDFIKIFYDSIRTFLPYFSVYSWTLEAL